MNDRREARRKIRRRHRRVMYESTVRRYFDRYTPGLATVPWGEHE